MCCQRNLLCYGPSRLVFGRKPLWSPWEIAGLRKPGGPIGRGAALQRGDTVFAARRASPAERWLAGVSFGPHHGGTTLANVRGMPADRFAVRRNGETGRSWCSVAPSHCSRSELRPGARRSSTLEQVDGSHREREEDAEVERVVCRAKSSVTCRLAVTLR